MIKALINRVGYWRRGKTMVAHFEDCHYMLVMANHDTKLNFTERKPSGCTLCDACQRIEKARRLAGK